MQTDLFTPIISLYMKRKRIVTVSFLILMIVALLIIKAEYASLIYCGSTYGMPALVAKGSAENLYLGSSMFRQGLDIDTIESHQNDSYILAYNGNQPISELIELNYLIDKNVEIEHLYVDMYAYSMTALPDISDDKLLLETDIATKYRLWDSIEDKSFSKLWSVCVAANNDMILTAPVVNPILNSQFRNGGTFSVNKGLDNDAYNNLAPPIDTDIIIIEQEKAVRDIVILCRENGIDVTFIETPKSRVVMQDQNYESVMESYKIILNELEVKYISSEDYEFDYDDSHNYIDAIHLSYQGRVNFSEKLLTCDKFTH